MVANPPPNAFERFGTCEGNIPWGEPGNNEETLARSADDPTQTSAPDNGEARLHARQWLRDRWGMSDSEFPNEGHVSMLADYAAALTRPTAPSDGEAVEAAAAARAEASAAAGYHANHGRANQSPFRHRRPAS